MLPFLCSAIGTKGALMIGLTVAQLITYYWNSKENPPKIHMFGRRIHHGEIGALLTLSLLFSGKVPVSAAGILAGLGGGLIKDDFSDIKEWFRFKKRGREIKRKKSIYPYPSKGTNSEIITTTKKEIG